MEKENVKKLLLDELLSKGYFQFNTWEHRQNIINENFYFDKLAGELCDLSLDRISMFTEEETSVLRKRLGFFDEGNQQSFSKIAVMIGKSSQTVSNILSKCYRSIYRYINYVQGKLIYEAKDNRSKMSSLSICSDKEFHNYPISKLEIDRKVLDYLYSKRINTLYDLLSYNFSDFKLKQFEIGEKSCKDIQKAVHNLGLKFIDELIDEEKSMIVKQSSEEVINKSSISWIISPLTYTNIYTFKCKNVEKIADLIRYYKEEKWRGHSVYEQNLINSFMEGSKRIGIYIGYKISEDTINSYELQAMPIEDLLRVDISDVEISPWLLKSLEKLDIQTLGDIVSHNKADFKTITPYTTELFSVISKLGLFFKDDLEQMKFYADAINFQKDDCCHTLSSEEQMLFMYRSLVNAKKLLARQIAEIDKKINSLEEKLTRVPGYEKRKI